MPATPRDAANWFEIPATDLDRATAFYEALLATTLQRGDFGEPTALFPSAPKGVGGALVLRPQHQPALAGALVYLNADGPSWTVRSPAPKSLVEPSSFPPHRFPAASAPLPSSATPKATTSASMRTSPGSRIARPVAAAR